MRPAWGITIAIVFLAGAVRAQEAAALFAAPVVVTDASESFRAALDMNGDGDKDALSVWFQGPASMRVSGWRNDGTGVFSLGWAFNVPLAFNPPLGPQTEIQCHVAVGDWDGDGKDDFAISVDKLLGWYLSTGDTTTPFVFSYAVFASPVVDLAVADFDQDGLRDVAALTAAQVRIYRSQLAAQPALLATYTFAMANAKHLTTGELTGDAFPDVAVLRSSSIEIYGVAGSVMQPGATFVALTSPFGIVAGDVDVDGDADIVVYGTMPGGPFGFTTPATRVARRTGPATFVLDATQAASFPALLVAPTLVDVDRDGDLDLLTVGGNSGLNIYQPMSNIGGSLYVAWLNDGTGSFLPGARWNVVGPTGELAIADVDADGDLDLIAGRCVSFNFPGRGMISPDSTTVDVTGLCAFGDSDNDGDLDIGHGADGVALNGGTAQGGYTNDGAGVFTAASRVLPPAAPGTSYNGPGFPGDFDGDGTLDLLVEHVTGTSASAGFEMRFMRNLGGGALADGGPATATGPTMRVVASDSAAGTLAITYLDHHSELVTDVDGDLDPDIIVFNPPVQWASTIEAGARVWCNDGTGFFTAVQDLPGDRPTACADLTGDGLPDLVAIRRSGAMASIVVLRGLGGGTFGNPTTLVPGLSSFYMFDQPAIFDADGDGDRDVVAGTPAGMVVFTNDGLGNLTQAVIGALEPSNSRRVVRGADVNGDGLVDILISPAIAATRVWLRAPAGPGWLPPQTYATGELANLADIDGDGDLDALAYAGYITRNVLYDAPANGLRLQYGAGLAGSGGLVPILGTTGPVRVGSSGELRITNALGGAYVWVAIGAAPDSFPALGGTVLVMPSQFVPLSLGGPAGVAGAGSAAIPWTIPPGSGSVAVYGQVAILDPGAQQGFSFTQGLGVVVGY